MVTKQQYVEAKKIVTEWLNAQPGDSKYPYKPKLMSTEDYARQRALNEVLRLLAINGTITYDEFGKILDQFDLSILTAPNNKNQNILFIKWQIEKDAFTSEKVKSDYTQIKHLVNNLSDNDPDDNLIDTSK